MALVAQIDREDFNDPNKVRAFVVLINQLPKPRFAHLEFNWRDDGGLDVIGGGGNGPA